MTDPALAVTGLVVRQGEFCLDQVSLSCRADEYHVLLGPTGCGKSTLLRALLGLIRPLAGTIRLDGRILNDCGSEERRFGYLPQHQYLFPHLDVAGNILFAFRERQGREEMLARLCGMLGLEPLRRRSIRNLSGGERQKVALARALAARPRALLLDEPFSAIDEGGRRELWFELRRAVAAAGVACLHVTHNLDEAYTLGDRVSVMIAGRMLQTGPPREILERPATESVARFIGYRNIFRGTVRPHARGFMLDCGGFSVVVAGRPPGPAATLCIRPQDIKLLRPGDPVRAELAANQFDGTVTALFHLPDACVARFKVAGSAREFDLEMRFPAAIAERFAVVRGARLRLGLWQPGLIVWA